MCNRKAVWVMGMYRGCSGAFSGRSSFSECRPSRFIPVVLWWCTPDFIVLVDRNVAELSHWWRAIRYLKQRRNSILLYVRILGKMEVSAFFSWYRNLCTLKVLHSIIVGLGFLCRAGVWWWLRWRKPLGLCGALSALHFFKSLLQEPLYTSVGTALLFWEVCFAPLGHIKWD